MARSRNHLLGHLFAAVKARHEAAKPGSDQEKAEFIAASRMPVQAEVARDRSKRISVRCPRRAGKSWFALSIAIEQCLRKPGSVWVIVGLTRPSIQQIFWSLIKQISQTLELGLTFKEVELTAQFFNGSIILFRGAETRSEIEKLRGSQYDGAIVDECKSFNPVVFTELIQDVIEPALGDRRGILFLIGTPGDVLAGPFYEATATPAVEYKDEHGKVIRTSNRRFDDAYIPIEGDTPYVWSFHSWTLQDNVELPHLWDEALATKKRYGWSDDHPTWRREYLGEWVASRNRLVYRFVPSLHEYDGRLPDGHVWRYCLGLDIGYVDADAIVVWAWAEDCHHIYQVYGEKRPKLNLTALAAWVREVRAQLGAAGPDMMTADFGGLATKLFSELATTHGLYFEPAEKKEKTDFIEIMNNDFDAGRIHILSGNALGKELLTNRWLEKSLGTPKKVEDPKTPNDLCDAALYGWRWCSHRKAQDPSPKTASGTPQWWRERVAAEMQEAIALHLRNKGSKDDDYKDLDKDWWHGES